MRLLLDTHAFLWASDDDHRLSRLARRRIADARNQRFLSIASVWEMAIKVGTGRLRLRRPLAQIVAGAQEQGVGLLPITPEHAIAVAALAGHHGDPFDRMLIAQAMSESLDLVSRDEAIDAFPVRRIW